MDHSLKTRILIVEDNLDDVDLLMRQLRKANLGEQVMTISDGRLALDFLMLPEASHLVALFLDLKLPSMSGVQLLEKIRAHDKIRNLPVIVMTSSNSSEDLQKCTELRVLNYVQKPVTLEAFNKAVASTFHLPDTAAP